MTEHELPARVRVQLGVFVSYALEPVVGRLVAWRIRRPLAAAVVLLTLVGSFGWATYALSDDALVRRAPEAGVKLRDAVGRIRWRNGAGPVADVARFADEVENSAEAAAPPHRRRPA